ncbi:hypothetical protein AGDE_09229 [Angomonas deanei]|uniref:EF-hand domain-containing protein n=1 Tax=Angomonas deanei TaxID=59799 RepID=A0A7G2CLK8_9TRYP|nr:hypothetical protein AGDE_09229 [Angomonas deanei]CAD2219142.1 hypothetical protein, conserved [Angomonas deanei]|eukprot:EPY31088.1 hypothetical protein AGDE_09229 [Angomonas deanei]
MEILKNLSANELKTLKDTFSSNLKGALKEEDFVDAIFSACHKKPKFAELTKGQLSHLFASIDVTGRGYVSWEEFSMFAIEQAQYSMETVVGGGATNSGDGRQGDDMGAGDGRSLEGNVDTFITFRPYHVESAVQHSYGTVVNDLRSLPRARKLVQIIQDTKNNSQVTLINMDETQSVYAKLPKVNECITAWEYVPLTTGVTNSNSLFFSYNGGNVTTFPLEKKHTYDDMLSSSGSLLFSETQTALVWSSMYGRLLLGSRRGIVSVWDIDSKAVSSQEKVHQSPITALKVRSSVLFSSSLDRVNSVKGVDLEHSVVRFAFNDHMVGGATCLEIDEEFLFTAGFEGKVMQRNLQNPKGSPTILFDTNEPHQGRITTMERKADTPLLFLVTAKAW